MILVAVAAKELPGRQPKGEEREHWRIVELRR